MLTIIAEIYGAGKNFLKNAYVLEIFNKILPIYHFLPFPISKINISLFACGVDRRHRRKNLKFRTFFESIFLLYRLVVDHKIHRLFLISI